MLGKKFKGKKYDRLAVIAAACSTILYLTVLLES